MGGKRDTGIVSCSCPGISSSFSLPPSGVSRLYDVTRFKTSFPSRASRLPYLLLAATPAPFTSTSSPRRSWRELCSAPLACRTATKERAGGMAAPVRLRCACFPWGGRCDVRHRVQRRLSRHYQSPIRNSPRASRPPTCLFCTSSRISARQNRGHTADRACGHPPRAPLDPAQAPQELPRPLLLLALNPFSIETCPPLGFFMIPIGGPRFFPPTPCLQDRFLVVFCILLPPCTRVCPLDQLVRRVGRCTTV